MALVVNFYSDWMCTTPAKNFSLGVAGVTGQYSQLSQWQRIGSYLPKIDDEEYYFYQLNAYDNMGFALGGGSAIYDYDFPSQIPYSVNVPTDLDNQNSSTLIYNPMFTGRGGVYQGTTVAFAISLVDFDSPSYPGTKYFTIRMYSYSQVPDSGTRTSWNYRNSSRMFEINAPMPANTAYPLVKIFQITIENQKFYMLACGVSGSNALHPASAHQPTTLFLIPDVYFTDQPNEPYVGPVTKESVEGSFLPTNAYKDNIEGRKDINKDPFGLASATPYLALLELNSTEYQWMTRSIYCGTNVIDLGSVEDLVTDIFGPISFIPESQQQGNPMPKHRRNTDEVEVMTKGVLSSKLIPSCFEISKGNKMVDASICGISLNFDTAIGKRCLTSIGTKKITTGKIERRLNSFLDYEPYTSMEIFVPFCGKVAISPSMVYGNSLEFEFYCDLITGTLSCDISIIESNSSRYLYTTLQGNCGIDMPMVGAAGNNISAFTAMTGGIAALANSAMINPMATAMAIPGAATSIMKGIREAQIDTPVIDRGSANMNPYFSPRECYMIINVPKPANPKSYISLHGGVINASGTVGSFATAGSNGGSESGGTRYAVFSEVDLDGVPCTQAEKEEIYRLLKGGVFL